MVFPSDFHTILLSSHYVPFMKLLNIVFSQSLGMTVKEITLSKMSGLQILCLVKTY